MDDIKKAELLKGMFAGATFYKSVVAGVVEQGATLSYEKEDNHKQDSVDTTTGKKAILEYVDRLKPLISEEYQERYDELWMGILELKEVREEVYDKGKQQDTTFNRNLVAQIFHMMADKICSSRKEKARRTARQAHKEICGKLSFGESLDFMSRK